MRAQSNRRWCLRDTRVNLRDGLGAPALPDLTLTVSPFSSAVVATDHDDLMLKSGISGYIVLASPASLGREVRRGSETRPATPPSHDRDHLWRCMAGGAPSLASRVNSAPPSMRVHVLVHQRRWPEAHFAVTPSFVNSDRAAFRDTESSCWATG